MVVASRCTSITRCSRPLRVQNLITRLGNRALRRPVPVAPSSFCSAAFVGAGVGNFARSHILKQGLGQFSALTTGVALACVSYLLALLGLGQVIPGAMSHQEGYIGAMLFVIPGFPLITAGLDIAKLDMRSGIERLSYAVSIIVMATLVGWMVAEMILPRSAFRRLPLRSCAW